MGAVVQALVLGTGLRKGREIEWYLRHKIGRTWLGFTLCLNSSGPSSPRDTVQMTLRGLHIFLAKATMKPNKDIGTYLYSQPEAKRKILINQNWDRFVFLSRRRMTFQCQPKHVLVNSLSKDNPHGSVSLEIILERDGHSFFQYLQKHTHHLSLSFSFSPSIYRVLRKVSDL